MAADPNETWRNRGDSVGYHDYIELLRVTIRHKIAERLKDRDNFTMRNITEFTESKSESKSETKKEEKSEIKSKENSLSLEPDTRTEREREFDEWLKEHIKNGGGGARGGSR
jgi:hypothetical protein